MKQLFLVEDHDELREIFSDILIYAGYKVTAVRNAIEAQKLLTQCHFAVDLVITDIIMPKVTGLELRHWAHQSAPLLKFLFISGYMEDKKLTEGIPFLSKPFSEDALLKKIEDVLNPTESRIDLLHPLVS